MKKLGCVHLVGAGPGDPDLLTMKAARLISSAQVVVYDRLVSEAVLAMIPASARRIDVGKESGRHSVPQPEINSLLVSLARDGHDVVRLKGGDPFVFGRGGEEARELARHGIPHHIVPGISAAMGCAAAAGIPLTFRGLSDGVRLVTGHRQEDRDLDLDWQALADPNCTLVVYMGMGTSQQLADNLQAAGLPATTPVAIIERGTTPQQRTIFSSVGRLAEDVATHMPKPPALLIIGKVVGVALERPSTCRQELAEGVDA
ncbi:MAG: uroporphyrinogen-III C-methyltransferase [Rhodospirillaceae bacterium]|nr:uroporphyrinogen-III C-methyltransferase [Rhodospirillales bacterium]